MTQDAENGPMTPSQLGAVGDCQHHVTPDFKAQCSVDCTAATTHLAAGDGKEAAVWRPGNERLARRAAAKAPCMPLNIVKGAESRAFAVRAHVKQLSTSPARQLHRLSRPPARSSALLLRRRDVRTIRSSAEGSLSLLFRDFQLRTSPGKRITPGSQTGPSQSCTTCMHVHIAA